MLPLVFRPVQGLPHAVRQPGVTTVPPPLSCPGRKFIDGLPMKPATNSLFGLGVQVSRRIDLLYQAAAHDHDPVPESHCLGLVIGHVQRRGGHILDEFSLRREGFPIARPPA